MANTRTIDIVAQHKQENEDHSFKELHEVDTVARRLKVLKMPDGNTTVIIQGRKRFKMIEEVSSEPYLHAKVKEMVDVVAQREEEEKVNAIIDSIKVVAMESIKKESTIQ